jgi:O-antigen/teichoic acid export membrane protein
MHDHRHENKTDTESLAGTIRRSGVYVLIGKLITPVLTFLITVYIVRKLDVGQYGIYNILLAVMAYVGLLSSLGLVHIFKRFLPEFLQHKAIGSIRRMVMSGLGVRLILSLLFLVLIGILSGHLGKLLKIENFGFYFQWFALGILFFLESQLLGVALVSIFLHRFFVLAQIGYSLIRAGIVVFLLESGYDLRGLLIAESLGFLILVLLQSAAFHRGFLRLHPGEKGETLPWKRVIRYGGFSYFNEMGEQILDVSTDFFIISAFLGAHETGLYAFSAEVMRMIYRWMPHYLLMDVITPAFFTRYTRNRKDVELGQMFNLIFKSICFLFMPIVVGIFVLGDKMVATLFDPKYLEALPVLWIVAGFTLINASAFPLGLVVEAVEKVEIHFYGKMFSIYNLIGDLLVVKPFGIIGVAVVTSTAILFKNLYTFFRIRKWVTFSIDWRSLLIILENALFMGAMVYLMRPLAGTLHGFIGVVLAGCIIYLAAAIFHKAFNAMERDQLKRIVPGSRFPF